MINKFRGELALLVTVIIWGYGFVAVGQSLYYMSPFQMLFIRFAVALAASIIVFHKKIIKLDKDTLIKGLILGTIQFVGFCFQTVGFVYTTPSNNAFLTSVYVIIVPLIAFFLFRRKPDIHELIGAAIAMVGISVLTFNHGGPMNIGDILTLLCAVAFAFQIFYTTKFMKDKDPVGITIMMIASCFVLSSGGMLIEGNKFTMPPSEGIYAILFLALISTFFSTILQNYGQKFTTETRAAIFFSTEALWGTIFSVIFLNEVVTVKLIIGGLLIFTAIVIAETKLGLGVKPAPALKPNSVLADADL